MKSLISLSELFQNKIFRIPDYQRGYAWQTEQLTDFWEDIINLPKDHYHYTGMISLKMVDERDYEKWDEHDKWIIENKKYKGYHVVDGQQRLTTCVILLKSIIDFAKKENKTHIKEDKIEDIIVRYLFEENKSGILRAYKFGYEKDNPSFDYLKYKILESNSPRNLEKTFYTFNLLEAKNYFDQKISEQNNDGFGKVEEIFIKVVNYLHFNLYEIESDFDVNVAFETMNNRGKKLSNLEILKNRLIYLTTIYDESILKESEKREIRVLINNSWKEIYKQLGRDETNPLPDDEYLRNHWIMYFKYTRQKGDDYIKYLLKDHFTVRAIQGKEREIKLYSEQKENGESIEEVFTDDSVLHYDEIIQYTKNISEISRYWFYSFYPDYAKEMALSSVEIKWMHRLNRVGIASFRPLVVASLRNQNITTEERVNLYQTIEKCIFVWFRMAGFNNSLYSFDAYNFSRTLLENNNTDLIIQFFNDKFDENYEGAKEAYIARIKNYFVRDGYFDWQDLKYFLYEYEDYLFEKSRKKVPLNEWRTSQKGFYSIEHIYPQTPNDWYWNNEFRDYSNQEKSICIKTIGNLLLLSKDINSSLQNHSYPRKCNPLDTDRPVGYSSGSFSEREVFNTYQEWNPDSIYKRGKKLLGFFRTRWGISFNNAEKEQLLGMQFIQNERKITKELFNNNTLNEMIKSTFESQDFLVNTRGKYIQIMKSNWIFNDSFESSIHFEIKTDKNTNFQELFGNHGIISLVFHTEKDCPDELRKNLRSTRKEIDVVKIVCNFENELDYLNSVELICQTIIKYIDKYSYLIDQLINEYNQKTHSNRH